jgi:hypothetical protein
MEAHMAKRTAFTVAARILPDGQSMTIAGRDAWALDCLYRAGPAGATPIDHPGPRWSHYVFKLRRMGFNIETITESHGGQFSGHHARYVLRSTISLVVKGEDETRAAA